jgi:hypothetical protein
MKAFTIGLVGLANLAAAVPVLQERNLVVAYGDRSDYAAAYNAGQGGSGSSPSGSSPNTHGTSPYQGGTQGSGTFPKIVSDKPFALDNGFPNIKNPSPELDAINQAARGTLSNAPPPAKGPSAETLTSLQLVQFNENWESYFFSDLLQNITEGVPGYEFQDQKYKEKIVNVLTAVLAQEQLHALNAGGALTRFGAGPIKPCQYIAPVSNFHDAIFLASTFTDIVMGTLADMAVVSYSPQLSRERPSPKKPRSPVQLTHEHAGGRPKRRRRQHSRLRLDAGPRRRAERFLPRHSGQATVRAALPDRLAARLRPSTSSSSSQA